MTMTIDATDKRFTGTSLSTARKGHQTARVELAANEIWGGWPPPWIGTGERNAAYYTWFGDRGLPPPSERQLNRIHGGR
jgi:hypothetical protein